MRPHTEDEVVELVKLARRENLKLVPRAWATSGYGGVLPPKDAVVIDMSAMMRVLERRCRAARRSRTQAVGDLGADRPPASTSRASTLRLYPSSYPSSSVAGWLAQGGSGFGSYEYGMFKENVVSARVVLPTGEVRELLGRRTARATSPTPKASPASSPRSTFRVRPLEDEVHRLIAFPDAATLGAAAADIVGPGLPIWSITFLNPESTRLKKQLPHRHGHPYEEAHEHYEPEAPEAYLAVIAYPASAPTPIDAPLAAIVEKHGGTELGAEAAEHEWEQRFAPMRLKRIGPSIIPTEVIVPLAEMPAVLGEIDDKIDQPFILEGMVGKGDKVVLLGFIPHDERSFDFNVAFALSLSVIKIAKAHGGAAYSTGLYFRREADSVLGAERAAALDGVQERASTRTELMNPGKVLGSGLHRRASWARRRRSRRSCVRSRTLPSRRQGPAT